MTDETTLDQARLIHRSLMVFRKRMVARHLSGADQRGQGCGCDLTLAQMNMVMLVHEHGQMTLKDLAEALRVSPPSASAMVDRLVETGVLTREQNRADRREVIIRTAASAATDIQAAERQALGAIVEVLEKLGSGYAKAWCDIQCHVMRVLEEEFAAKRSGRDSSGEVTL